MNLEQLAQGGRVLKVARMGHPILSQVADEIDPTSMEAKQIVRDMAATVLDYGEIGGLAAPQVFIPKRILFYNVPKRRADEHNPDGVPLTIIANVTYKPIGEETITALEACLSLPEMAGEVERYKGISYKFQDMDGNWHEEEASGYHAKVIQHEADHLDGIMYPQRMKDMSRFGHLNEVLKFMQAA